MILKKYLINEMKIRTFFILLAISALLSNSLYSMNKITQSCIACTPVRALVAGGQENVFTICQTKLWKYVLNPNQHYLGRGLLVLQRHIPDLEQLTDKEEQEFIQWRRTLTPALKTAFGGRIVNLLYGTNLAFRETPPNPHVHWHFIPRNESKVTFAGQIFHDTEWASVFDLSKKDNMALEIQPFQKAIMATVASYLKKQLQDDKSSLDVEFIIEHYVDDKLNTDKEIECKKD